MLDKKALLKKLSAKKVSATSKEKSKKKEVEVCPYKECLVFPYHVDRTGRSNLQIQYEYLEEHGIVMYDKVQDIELSWPQYLALQESVRAYQSRLHEVLWSFRKQQGKPKGGLFNSMLSPRKVDFTRKGEYEEAEKQKAAGKPSNKCDGNVRKQIEDLTIHIASLQAQLDLMKEGISCKPTDKEIEAYRYRIVDCESVIAYYRNMIKKYEGKIPVKGVSKEETVKSSGKSKLLAMLKKS